MCLYITSIRHSIDNTYAYNTISFILRNDIIPCISYIMALHTTNLSPFQKKRKKINQQKIIVKFSTSQLQINSQERIGQPSTKLMFLLDSCQFSLNISIIYYDSFPTIVFFGSDKSLNDLFWFFSRSSLVQFKSLNGLSWTLSRRHFLFWVRFKPLNGLSRFFPSR